MPQKEQTLQRKKLLDANKHLISKMKVSELAKHLDIPVSAIYYYIEKNGVTYKDGTEEYGKPREANETGYFNVNERENWLI